MAFNTLMVDVDGVLLVHPRPGGWSETLERDLGVSPAALQSAFFAPHWREIILGRASLDERLTPVLAQIAPQVSPAALIDYWFTEDAHVDAGLLADISAVRANGLAAHLATVQEHQRARWLWMKLGLGGWFDAMHYSADLGAAKPDQRFFALIEARTGLTGADIFYIDDKAENIEAARVRGWAGAVWTPGSRLADVLGGAGFRAA